MNYRTVELLASGDQADGAGTKIIDIRVREMISRIMIYWQVGMNGYDMNSYQHKDIIKIELVDGSDVLFSLDGGQAQALNIYDRKCDSMNYKQKLDGNSLASNYAIDFGRFLHDPMLAFDPTRFNNPQLKITYNEDICDTSSTSNELGVKAEVFDEKVINPMGFLSAKEVSSRVPPASGYSYFTLPTDRTLRKLLIQGYLADFEPWYTVSEARLDEDGDKRVIFDWNIERYYRMMQSIWRPVEDEIVGMANTSGTKFYVTPTDYYAILAATVLNDITHSVTQVGYGRGGGISMWGDGSVQLFEGVARGFLPNHCVEFPMGDPGDIEDWYDVTKVGDLRLRLNVGSYSASARQSIVVQQLRRY